MGKGRKKGRKDGGKKQEGRIGEKNNNPEKSSRHRSMTQMLVTNRKMVEDCLPKESLKLTDDVACACVVTASALSDNR